MKKFIIRVNGKAYDVEVEEIGCDLDSAKPEHRPLPGDRPKSGPKLQPPAISEPTEAPESKNKILAPMAGTIVKIFIKAGDVVESGDVLLVLEAMKMENDVVASVTGTIASVSVEEGNIINAGDVLVTLA